MDLLFTPVSWVVEDSDEGSSGDENALEELQFTVRLFGRTSAGQSVCLSVPYYPHFYVEIPKHWGQFEIRAYVRNFTRLYPAEHLCSAVTAQQLYGFSNGSTARFLRLAFHSHKYSKWAQRTVRRLPAPVPSSAFRVWEGNVPPELQLMHERDLTGAAWVQATGCRPVPPALRQTSCKLECTAPARALSLGSAPESLGAPPLVLASWDLEVYSPDGAFPDADREDCPIIQIGCTFQRFGCQEPYARHVLVLGACEPVDGVEIASFEDEAALLRGFQLLLREHDVDVHVHYNGWGFDCAYLYKRAVLLDVDGTFNIGRLKRAAARLKTISLASAAYGSNEWKVLESTGSLQVDMYVLLKKETKHDSYKLDNMAEFYLGERKVDLAPADIFANHRAGPAGRAKVARYCSVDCELPLRLMTKLSTLANLLEMANATMVPADYLLPRGQQIRVFSQVLKKAHQLGYLVPVLEDSALPKDATYEGATVLEAKRGAYFDPVCGLDFASLYPSIMRAHTLCYSTIVLDAKHDNLPGVEYFEVTTDMGTFRFAQTSCAVLPSLLAELAKFRKQAKRDMAAAKERGDKFMESVFNAKQLAFKVSMNSCYGFCGALKGFLPCMAIAASITAEGRNMIAKTKAIVERDFGGEVVYGDTDSVMVRFKAGDDFKAHFDLAYKAADAINATFREPIAIEVEKLYCPYILYSKKRYAGLMYTKPEKPDYVDTKGLSLVRRDSCKLVRSVCEAALHSIMHDLDTAKAVASVQAALMRLVRGEVPTEQLLLSKTLRTDYKSEAQPHLQVARAMEKRAPGSGPRSGDRVPFVYVITKDELLKQYQKAEDPAYAAEQGLKLDVLYYIEHQLTNPLVSMFAPLLSAAEDKAQAEQATRAILFGSADLQHALQTYQAEAKGRKVTAKRVQKNASNKQAEITGFFNKKPRT